MRLNIRERRLKIATEIRQNATAGLETLSNLLEISKSSIHRHRKALFRAAQHPESSLWETSAGSLWLKLLVLGVIYYFGIKQGVGSESLSEFFRAIHLNEQVGISASTLRKLEQEMKTKILDYETVQAKDCQPKPGQGICVGGDETFFGGSPILVMIELASNYILTEVESSDRTYRTWGEQISQWWTSGEWHCRFMVSDGARALIKLAISGLGTVSIPDLFHALRKLSQPLGRTLGRQLSQLQRQQQNIHEQLKETISTTRREVLETKLAQTLLKLQTIAQDQEIYHNALHQVTQRVHPFNLNTHDSQLANDVPMALITPLETLSRLANSYDLDSGKKAIDGFKALIPGFTQGIQAWWQWTHEVLAIETDDIRTQNWVITALLPWIYWKQQSAKTRTPALKQSYQIAAERAYQALINHPDTQDLYQPFWVDWSQEMTHKYQRTSSAVEGRNGYLSRLHHAGRGFSPQTLKVATIIHNFDLKRADGTTAAQRLFGHEFPNLFDSIVDSMGDLPMPRKSSKAHRPKSLPTLLFPD
jgi:Family of unknown function (DUF6399)